MPWRIIGTVAAALSWLLFFAVQIVSGDFLPPAISVSQYGVGPHGWIFSCWMVANAIAIGSLYLSLGRRETLTTTAFVVGVVGTMTMALVRTDPDGLQQSWGAKVHMIGAVLELAGMPIGMWLAMRTVSTRWGATGLAFVVGQATALALLLVAATGVPTAWTTAPKSWAFWQAVAIGLQMVQLLAFAACCWRPGRSVATRKALPDRSGVAR